MRAGITVPAVVSVVLLSLLGCGAEEEEEAIEPTSSVTAEAARAESELIRLRGELRQIREAKAQVEALRAFEAHLYQRREALDPGLRRCLEGDEVILAVTLRSDGASTMAQPVVDSLALLRGSGETELDEARARCVRQHLGRSEMLGFWPVPPGEMSFPEQLRFEWPAHHVAGQPVASWVEEQSEP